MTTTGEPTREQVLALPAGRDLDALVAERVMGWRHDRLPQMPREGEFWLSPDGTFAFDDHDLPRYSTDVADAWQTIEKVGHSFRLDNGAGRAGYWRADFLCLDAPYCEGQGETPALAICRAALLTTLRG